MRGVVISMHRFEKTSDYPSCRLIGNSTKGGCVCAFFEVM